MSNESNIQTFNSCTAFAGPRRIASGEPGQVALAVKRTIEADPWASVLVFDDVTSETIEFDLRGTDENIVARLDQEAKAGNISVANNLSEGQQDLPDGVKYSGPGRPKLGVVAREVTLLPRHWDWLNQQSGGASVAIRKLVEEARRAAVGKDRIRKSQEATYRFLSAIAGNLPDFEEATRALFAGDGDRFDTLIKSWPIDIRDYAQKLAAGAFQREGV